MLKHNYILLSLALILSSCSYRVLDFTIISSKNIDLSRLGELESTNARVDGKAKAHIVLFYAGKPSLKEAIDEAIESIDGAVALTDGVIYEKWWWAIPIYGQTTLIIEGTPLIDPSKKKLKDTGENNLYYKINVDGENSKIEQLEETEYVATTKNLKNISTKKVF